MSIHDLSPLRVEGFRLDIEENEESLKRRLLHYLGLREEDLHSSRVIRQALDARKKTDIHYRLSLEVQLNDPLREEKLLKAGLARRPLLRPQDERDREIIQGPAHGMEALVDRPLIVGGGPGGLFAAWLLAREGYQPLLIERGPEVSDRVRARRLFNSKGIHDPENNILFGEGGAGTFSDGKLTTRSRSPLVRLVHEVFLEAGAPEDIAVKAKPHIGTDRLRAVLIFLRRNIEKLGGEFVFGNRMEYPLQDADGRIQGIKLSDGSSLPCRALLLAPGHSSRDTFENLHRHGVAMEFKPFQSGLRIEHPQQLIDDAQFGSFASRLPAAEYILNDRQTGIFSFCMCPGGNIVASISEAEYLCTNGMSRRRRSSRWANAALMMTVEEKDIPAPADSLSGLQFQRLLEKRGFELGKGNYDLPAQRARDFLRRSLSSPDMNSSYARGLQPANLREILPPGGSQALSSALQAFDRRIPGFIEEGILVGPETRGSSPIRILRDQLSRESITQDGLYPVGEGAGAAGGIISSAIDGLRSAAALIRRFAGP